MVMAEHSLGSQNSSARQSSAVQVAGLDRESQAEYVVVVTAAGEKEREKRGQNFASW